MKHKHNFAVVQLNLALNKFQKEKITNFYDLNILKIGKKTKEYY